MTRRTPSDGPRRPARRPRGAGAAPAPTPEAGSEAERASLLLGLGLDGDDGHTRITRGRDVLLVGGSEDTHGEMQEKAIRFNEELDRRGMRLADVRCTDELREIADRAGLLRDRGGGR